MERQGGRVDAMKYETGREAGSEGEINCEVVREGGGGCEGGFLAGCIVRGAWGGGGREVEVKREYKMLRTIKILGWFGGTRE